MLTGFNGERTDPLLGDYLTGKGYRLWVPSLHRFTSPDSWSPFGAGGIHPYACCEGDPVNRADPSGHMSLGQGIGLALGLVAGVALSIVTEGAAMPVVLSLLTTVAGDAVIGTVSELTAEVVDRQPINGVQVGIAAGMSAALTLAGFGLGRVVQRINSLCKSGTRDTLLALSKLRYVNGRTGFPMSGEFRNARFIGLYRRQEQVEWNIRFDDQLPSGTRRNFILGGIWERHALRVQNEIFTEDGWQVSYLTPFVFSRLFNQEDNITSYRLIFPQSAKASYYGGFNFAREFRASLMHRMPVMGYRDTPVLQGVLPDMLGRLQQLVTDMDRHGFIIYGDAAQSALDELAAQYAHRSGSLTVDGGDPRSYPQVFN